MAADHQNRDSVAQVRDAATDPETVRRPRVYVIGPNKCGTTSFFKFFRKNGIVTAHWVYQGRNLAVTMINNMALGRAPFAGFDEVEAFADLNHIEENQVFIEGARFFREIHRHDPDAYFILNTRDIDNWIASRVNYGLSKPVARINATTVEAVLDGWRTMFRTHHDEVRAHFADNPRFIEFNIETDSIRRVVRLLAPHYALKPKAWGKHFVTADRHERLERLAREDAAQP